MSGAVLIVDDDPSIGKLLEHTLRGDGFTALSVPDGASARAYVEREAPDAIILDLGLPDVDGKELLGDLIERRPEVPVLVLTASDAVGDIVECMRLGAVDYIQKPFDRTRVTTTLVNATRQAKLRCSVEKLSHRLRSREGFASIIGNSPAIRLTVDLLSRAATNDVVVLLQGESGTGKEVAARAIHVESPRRDGPFVTINCGAIPEGLIESELFGHERGSFTGATASRLGSFEQANGGTIFLDEIGELRMDLQVRLLRILQDRSVRPIGGSGAREIDVRVIAASNRDLKSEVARGNFREDLYYRLAVFPITLPPLRNRGADALLLADAFVARYSESAGKGLRGFSPEARHVIESYGWPGNVRELENVIERAVILEDGSRISIASLPEIVTRGAGGRKASNGSESPAPLASSLERATALTADDIVPLEEEERRIIRRALELTNWDAREASRRLRIGRATIYRKIDRYGLRSA